MRERNYPNPEAPAFIEIAKAADKLVTDFPSLIDKSPRGIFGYEAPFKLKRLLDNVQGESGPRLGKYFEMTLNLPDWPANLQKPKIFVLDTPESTATAIGRIKYDEENDMFHFITARFHTGYPALKDMAYAMRASLRLKPLLENISASLDSDSESESQIFMLHIAREGPLMRLEGGFFNELRVNIPYTIVHSEHKKVDDQNNQFGRIAKICNINYEGLIPEKIKTVAIADNTASGMQHVEVLRKVVEHIKSASGFSKNGPEQFLIFSPLLTDYGTLTISMFARSLGINVVFVTSSTILNCIPPQRYFSPVSGSGKLFVNPQHLLVNKLALGELSGKICSRCNWTASFTAVGAARLSSDAELKGYGWDNARLMEQCKHLTIKEMQRFSIDPRDYISYATLEEAQHFGKLNQLMKELG